MTSLTPTAEQAAAVAAFASGGNVAIHAGAGTGKTSTLQLIAEQARGQRGLYLAFNKSVADEAKRRFAGTPVTASTVHSLGYRAFGNRERLNQKHLWWQQVAAVVGAPKNFIVNPQVIVPGKALVRLTEETVMRFCRSAERQLQLRHVVLPDTILGDESDLNRLREQILELAEYYWADWMSPDGRIPHKHDTYLKQFVMSEPTLGYDFILVDEAQDLEPLTVSLLNGQSAQMIAVGDKQQAIYGWRGAVDALDRFGGQRVNLTQSWRFGDAIADAANFWLEALGSDIRLSGAPGRLSSVWPTNKREPEAVLTRTNAGAMQEILDAQARGVAVGIAGEAKVKELRDLAQAAYDLQTKGSTNHRDFEMFPSWQAVLDHVNDPHGSSDIRALVRVVDNYGAEKVVSAVDRCVPTDAARTVVSTVHVAKGLEWFHVRISEDFPQQETDKDGNLIPMTAEAARLNYVAVTRAKRHLDNTGLLWAAHGVTVAREDDLALV